MTKAWIQAFRLRTLPLSLACIGMAGFLAASGDAKALAESLVALQKNPVLAAEMADLASREAEARFSLDAMLSSYRQVYQEVIAATGVLS